MSENNNSNVDPFAGFDNLDTDPTMEDVEVQRVRATAAGQLLNDARMQAYIETNLGSQALDFAKQLAPLLMGLL